jgi:hypothetical protein
MSNKTYDYSNLQNYKENQSCMNLPVGFCSDSKKWTKPILEKFQNNNNENYWYWKTNYIDSPYDIFNPILKTSTNCNNNCFKCLPNV